MSQYVITDGQRFIYKLRNGKYVPTQSEVMADIFTKSEAKRICENQLSKPLRASFRVERYDKPSENGIRSMTQEDVEKNIQKVQTSENIQKWLNKVGEVENLSKDISKRKKELEKEQSKVDHEIQDCMHYIEFMSLNASQGYKIYKILKEKQRKRRVIKDELLVLNIILEQTGEINLEEIEKRIAGMDKRQYKPRAMEELFDL